MRPRPRLWSGMGGGDINTPWKRETLIFFQTLLSIQAEQLLSVFFSRCLVFDLFPFSKRSHLHFRLFFSLFFFWKMNKSAAVDGKPERSLFLDANHQRRCIRLIWRTNCLKALQNVLKPTLMSGMFVWVFWGGGRWGGGHMLCYWPTLPPVVGKYSSVWYSKSVKSVCFFFRHPFQTAL